MAGYGPLKPWHDPYGFPMGHSSWGFPSDQARMEAMMSKRTPKLTRAQKIALNGKLQRQSAYAAKQARKAKHD